MPELDLEERLRTTVIRQSQAYSPSPDLPSRIEARVRDRRRRRSTVLGAVAAGVLVVGGLGAVLATGADGDRTDIAPADSTTTTTTTVPETTSTVPPVTTSTTAADPTTTTPTTTPSTTASTTTTQPESRPEPSGVPVTGDTPLDRAGIGPIEAGMTLRQVEEQAGVPITPDELLAPSTTCATAGVDGTDLWLLAFESGAGADVLDWVVQSVQGASSTVEAVAIGMTRDDLRAAYGEPTETREYLYVTGGTVEVFADGPFAYSATLDGAGVITELESGLVAGVGNLEGCA